MGNCSVEMRPDVCISKSPAEAKVFDVFRASTERDAIVIHSLRLGEHLSKKEGEIDFLIITNEGLIAVEVKGGDISRNGSEWISFGMQGPFFIQDPFRQADENAHSLLEILKEKDASLSDLPIAYCVLFPDSSFMPEGVDIVPGTCFNAQTGYSLGQIVSTVLPAYRQRTRASLRVLSRKDVETVADLIQPRAPRGFYDKNLARIANNMQVMLTDEQKKIMDATLLNPRGYIEGTAGTGKTILAAHVAKLAVREKGCSNVLFLCFSGKLARWVKRELIGSDYPQITVTTFNAELQKDLSLPYQEGDFRSNLDRMIKSFMALRDEDITHYDYVVIDEGQDLGKVSYCQAIARMMKERSFAEASWRIFTDPDQNVFNIPPDFRGDRKKAEEEYGRVVSTIRSYNPFIFTLSKNCRNTKQISESCRNYTGYGSTDTDVFGPAVEYFPYNNTADERKSLFGLLSRLIRTERIEPSRIVILSPFAKSNPRCILHQSIGEEWQWPFLDAPIDETDVTDPKKGFIRFSTVQGFKGLESDCVIMCDVERLKSQAGDDKYTNILNYIGVSRAKQKLFMFCGPKCWN